MDGLVEQVRIALHQIWRRRWLAMGVAWGLCLLGWLVVALIPNSYESRAKVFVQLQSILPNQIGITPAERANDMLRVRQGLTSTANLERVVRRTDLNSRVQNDRDLAREVEALRQSIEIVASQDNIFEIKATARVSGFSNDQNARTSTAIVQGLLDLFVGENLGGDRTETGQSLAFLDEEIRRREGQLREAEQRRVEFEQRYMGQLPGDGSIAQRMSAARMEIANLDREISTAQATINGLRAQLGATPQNLPGLAGGGGGAAGQRLAQLEIELGQLQGRGLTDAHPDVVSTRSQIARLRPQAAAEQRAGGGSAAITNPSYISLRSMLAEREAQLNGATTRRAQLQSDLAQITGQQLSEPGAASEQSRLTREYDVMKAQYDRLLDNREQVRLRSDVQTRTDSVSFRVIDPPSRPTIPAAPNRPLLLSLILIVALGAGVAAAFVRGQLQTTFPTQRRLAAATGLPVFGTISELVSAADRAVRRRKLRLLAASFAALGGVFAVLMVIEFWQRSQVA
jgi:polysaccharide chain length determinant protein (PEP-CTERM system associated)